MEDIMKLTPTTAAKIVTAVETSNLPLYRIAARCGITYQTLRNWLRDGEDYQQQIEDGKLKKSNLNIKQKRKLDLYLDVEDARSHVESNYLQRILEIAEKKEDVKAFQWLLKKLHKIYRDEVPDTAEGEGADKPKEIAVSHLYGKDSNDHTLRNQFINGVQNNDEKADYTDDTDAEERS